MKNAAAGVGRGARSTGGNRGGHPNSLRLLTECVGGWHEKRRLFSSLSAGDQENVNVNDNVNAIRHHNHNNNDKNHPAKLTTTTTTRKHTNSRHGYGLVQSPKELMQREYEDVSTPVPVSPVVLKHMKRVVARACKIRVFCAWREVARAQKLERHRAAMAESMRMIKKLQVDMEKNSFILSSHVKRQNIQKTFFRMSNVLIFALVTFLGYQNYLMIRPHLSGVFWAALWGVFLSKPHQRLVSFFRRLDTVFTPPVRSRIVMTCMFLCVLLITDVVYPSQHAAHSTEGSSSYFFSFSSSFSSSSSGADDDVSQYDDMQQLTSSMDSVKRRRTSSESNAGTSHPLSAPVR